MIDSKTLSYEFPEEKLGFEEPPRQPVAPPAVGERAAVALIAAGLLGLMVTLLGLPLVGTWPGFFASFGLISAGGALFFFFRHRGTTPGIKHNGLTFANVTSRGLVAWGFGLAMTGFYVVLYFWPERLERATRLVDPLALALVGKPADHWFLYGFLYTAAVLVFGVRMLMKYRLNRYHLVRTSSVMFFQLGFAFLIPHILKALNQPEFYFSYFWPLKYEYLFPATVHDLVAHPGGLGTFLVFWGVVLTFVATPVLTYFFGKRWYCSWVCGCGGLAETLGDPFRQLSSKSERAWSIERWMVHSVLVLIAVLTALLWIEATAGQSLLGAWSATLRQWYGFFIGTFFSGIIGVGFYPIFGSRVWCRFGCPMAAILGLLQRCFSRFRITTNGGQCMSCGNCSTFCEMGIDVRAYAQRGENIVRASCVGCGVCAAVCPRGVLSLENGLTPKDRFAGAENPIQVLIQSFKQPRIYEPRPADRPLTPSEPRATEPAVLHAPCATPR
ncbi:MAG: 4Fe-4S dicluster domain-containing protein [Planctomycetota bacterium]